MYSRFPVSAQSMLNAQAVSCLLWDNPSVCYALHLLYLFLCCPFKPLSNCLIIRSAWPFTYRVCRKKDFWFYVLFLWFITLLHVTKAWFQTLVKKVLGTILKSSSDWMRSDRLLSIMSNSLHHRSRSAGPDKRGRPMDHWGWLYVPCVVMIHSLSNLLDFF